MRVVGHIMQLNQTFALDIDRKEAVNNVTVRLTMNHL